MRVGRHLPGLLLRPWRQSGDRPQPLFQLLLHQGSDREALGLRGRGPVAVITDLGILRPDPDTRRKLILTELPRAPPWS